MASSTTMHGCIICQKCNRACPICGTCKCKDDVYKPFAPWPIVPKSLKCDVCGSTAIDHTEKQCAHNRTLNSIKLTPKED